MAESGLKCPAIMKLGRPMRKLAIGVLLAGLTSAPAFADNIKAETITLRALDKVTAHTEDFTLKVGDTLTFGTLDVAVRHCEYRPPEDTPETYAFLQIKDRGLDEGKKVKTKSDATKPDYVFSGWMFASNPALSALDHPVYDVWVLSCTEAPRLRD